jgi:hypothetical protein
MHRHVLQSRVRWVLPCIIGLITFLAYGRALSGYFLGDDLDFLYYVARWTEEGTLFPTLMREFLSPQERGGFFYRPITLLSYGLDYLLWGANPVGWHLVNLILHIANALLLWVLVDHVLGDGRYQFGTIGVGFAASLLFAIRPSLPETVAWISGRPDQLALLGILISLIGYLRANGEWRFSYVLSLAGFLFALGSKEVGVTLPGGLLALHIAGAVSQKRTNETSRFGHWIVQILRGIGPFAVLLAVYFVWRLFLFGSAFTVYRSLPPIRLTDSEWLAAKLFSFRIFFAQTLSTGFLAQSFLFAIVVLVVLGCWAAFRSPVARRLWLFGIVWLVMELLALTKQLSVNATGEGVRLFYVPGAVLTILIVVPVVGSLLQTHQRELAFKWTFWAPAALVFIGMASLSFCLQREWLRPWIFAGRSMTQVVYSIAEHGKGSGQKNFAVLMIPDHMGAALFGRNGQGALMERPVQAASLRDRLLVATPPPQRGPFPEFPQLDRARLECWCWDAPRRRFERISVDEYTADNWFKLWTERLPGLQFSGLAEELGRF